MHTVFVPQIFDKILIFLIKNLYMAIVIKKILDRKLYQNFCRGHWIDFTDTGIEGDGCHFFLGKVTTTSGIRDSQIILSVFCINKLDWFFTLNNSSTLDFYQKKTLTWIKLFAFRFWSSTTKKEVNIYLRTFQIKSESTFPSVCGYVRVQVQWLCV